MNQHRVLMATDVPFWRKSTGAEQRMASLVQFLSSGPFQIKTFYLGQSNSERFTTRDVELIAEQNLEVDQRSSDQPPQPLAKKIGWYAQATVNQLEQWMRSSSESPSTDQSDNPPPPPSLEDYRWPWAISAFSDSVTSYQPHSIIVQYVKLAYLLDSLSFQQRNDIHCLIDTHDVLHLRAAQFQSRGFRHWIEISQEQEATELNKFDTIISIQAEEADLFRELAPSARTIVCGHAVGHSVSDRKSAGHSVEQSNAAEDGQAKISLGYVGSMNASNAQAIESFLRSVWSPLLESELGERFQFVIAGGICQWLVQADFFDSVDSAQIDLLGSIADLETFYNRVDLIVNPVEFGTGLKIKNCEAIAFGKPVLTTTQGNAGFAQSAIAATLVCDTPSDFIEQLSDLALNLDRFQGLKSAATKLSQAGFSEHQVYSELKQALLKTI